MNCALRWSTVPFEVTLSFNKMKTDENNYKRFSILSWQLYLGWIFHYHFTFCSNWLLVLYKAFVNEGIILWLITMIFRLFTISQFFHLGRHSRPSIFLSFYGSQWVWLVLDFFLEWYGLIKNAWHVSGVMKNAKKQNNCERMFLSEDVSHSPDLGLF